MKNNQNRKQKIEFCFISLFEVCYHAVPASGAELHVIDRKNTKLQTKLSTINTAENQTAKKRLPKIRETKKREGQSKPIAFLALSRTAFGGDEIAV